MTRDDITKSFRGSVGVAILNGRISGNKELLDADDPDVVGPFEELVNAVEPGLLPRIPTVATPRNNWGGRHYHYRVEGSVTILGNTVLAETVPLPKFKTDGSPDLDARGNQKYAPKVRLETRGEGGYSLVPGCPGTCHDTGLPYKHISGPPLTELPVLTAAEHKTLWDAARSFHMNVDAGVVREAPKAKARQSSLGDLTPGDDYNARATWTDILTPHGWKYVHGYGDIGYWRREGKTNGWSATTGIRSNSGTELFCCFTSSAHPFEGAGANGNCTSYSKFAAYATLNHGGDFTDAARELGRLGYGTPSKKPRQINAELLECASGWHEGPAESTEPPEPPEHPDPGLLPVELLRIPGFISDVMDVSLATAPYPNPALAFSGAITLLAALTGRRVRDEADNRTNLYLLGLAHSGSGKDWPRKVNTMILQSIGALEMLGDKFASGEGIQDALERCPAMLFQTDEIDNLIQTTKVADARTAGIVETLLQMYSTANSVFPKRKKAGVEATGFIDQPHLVLFGTAIPNHFYSAMSERLLTNGLLARTIIIESGPRSEGQEPGIIALPLQVSDTAAWWLHCAGGSGNLNSEHPVPETIYATAKAKQLLAEKRREAEAHYKIAEAKNSAVGTSVWARVPEQTRKLALIYSLSCQRDNAEITPEAVEWADAFMSHQTKRMLFMAASHVADTPFHAECLKLLGKLRQEPERQLPHSTLLRRMKCPTDRFQEMIVTLLERGDVQIVTEKTGGRAKREYRLIGA